LLSQNSSCLNRWITEVEWDPKALNKHRLEQLQCDSRTQYTKNSVIAIDWVKTALGPLCWRKTMVDGKAQWYFTKSIPPSRPTCPYPNFAKPQFQCTAVIILIPRYIRAKPFLTGLGSALLTNYLTDSPNLTAMPTTRILAA
jgi:hypothetical protein